MTTTDTYILVAEPNNAAYVTLHGFIDSISLLARFKHFRSFEEYKIEAVKYESHLLVLFESPENPYNYDQITSILAPTSKFCIITQDLKRIEDAHANMLTLLPSQFPDYLLQYITRSNEFKDEKFRKGEKFSRVIELQKKQLHKIQFEVDRFAYSVSHDLRAPLTSVLGLVYLLDSTVQDDVQKKYINLMKESIQRLDNTIRDIVAYAQNSRTKIMLSEISIKELTNSILETLTYLNTDELNIRNCVEITDTGVFVQDRSRLQIVLQSLIANAIRYRDPARNLKIEVSAVNKGRKIEICVKDNGLGIKEEHMSKIFEMFYRTNDQSTGSGLGLYIVRETLLNLKGKIEVKSEVHKGSEFKITIPLKTIKHPLTV